VKHASRMVKCWASVHTALRHESSILHRETMQLTINTAVDCDHSATQPPPRSPPPSKLPARSNKTSYS